MRGKTKKDTEASNINIWILYDVFKLNFELSPQNYVN